MEKKKYPKTFHLPYSEKLSSKDDRRHSTDDHFNGKEVIVTIKMDGENTSIYNDTSHARSIDSLIDSEDRRWIESLRHTKLSMLREGIRVCGENLFYKHTCEYNNLEDMFYCFSIWDKEVCLSWDDTTNMCDQLGIITVPVIYRGIYDKDTVMSIFKDYSNRTLDDVEGFVVRLAESFEYNQFKWCVSKFVNRTFEIPPQHWRHSPKTLNGLSNGKNPWEN